MSADGGRPGLLAWTDGGCRGNPGPGGWGFLLVHLATGSALERRGGEAQTTNNRMEMTAAIEVLEALTRPSDVEIRSDSRYLVDMCRTWMKGWKQRGWTKKGGQIKNLDLVKRLDELSAVHRITWTWVRGHAGDPGNEFVDLLTNLAMDSVQGGGDGVAERRHERSPITP